MQVDFYVLASAAPGARLEFACRLTEKAWRLGRQVYLLTVDESAAGEVDRLLWQFRADAFIPHRVIGPAAPPAPVLIGWEDSQLPDHGDVLINLTPTVPAFFDQFQRTSEIVIRDPDILRASRAHWRFYQEQGCDLNTHDIPG